MQSSPLHYAPAVPGHANRKARRLAVVVAVSALFLALCWGAWTGYLRDRIAYGRLWHRSENFAEPPTTPVYTTDPTLMPQLFKAGYLPSNFSTPAGPVAAWRRPTTWMQLETAPSQHGLFFCPCPFLHARSAGGQPSRIVAVQADIETEGAGWLGLRVWPETLVWSWPPKPYEPLITDTTGLKLWVKWHESFTLFAGQPDPADSSHFTIGYTEGKKPGTIDGRLNADGTVTLTIRDGPLFGRADPFK